MLGQLILNDAVRKISMELFTIDFFGDIVGKPGRRAVTTYLREQKDKADLTIANAENLAHGFGVTKELLSEMETAGIDVFTGGNHTFDRKDIFNFIDQSKNLLRPANYPHGTSGSGSLIIEKRGVKIGIINILGRAYMEALESPFIVAERLVKELSTKASIIFVDFHAEATAEKAALANYLDGQVSCVVGTHTHVQTADERILPKGTAFITDAGACCAIDSVIGMDFPSVYRKMVQQLPARFEVKDGPAIVCGIRLTLSLDPLASSQAKVQSIKRIRQEESN